MSADLHELYRELIVEHSKRPRNFRALGSQTRKAASYNPLCGDRVTVYADVSSGVLKDVTFQGSGCAICMASASLMTEALTGLSEAEAMLRCEGFCQLVTTGAASCAVALGDLAAFASAHKFPSRIKCALLAWRTLEAALQGEV